MDDAKPGIYNSVAPAPKLAPTVIVRIVAAPGAVTDADGTRVFKVLLIPRRRPVSVVAAAADDESNEREYDTVLGMAPTFAYVKTTGVFAGTAAVAVVKPIRIMSAVASVVVTKHVVVETVVEPHPDTNVGAMVLVVNEVPSTATSEELQKLSVLAPTCVDAPVTSAVSFRAIMTIVSPTGISTELENTTVTVTIPVASEAV